MRAGFFYRAFRSPTPPRGAPEEARTRSHTARLEAENIQESYQSKRSELHQLQRHFENGLASLSEFKPGDEVPVPQAGRNGKLVRIEFNRQVALVDVDNLQVEVPLRELPWPFQLPFYEPKPGEPMPDSMSMAVADERLKPTPTKAEAAAIAAEEAARATEEATAGTR